MTMSFMEAVKSCFSGYVNFSGRASRSEFWWFELFGILCALVVWPLGDFVAGLISLALLLPSLAVCVRRLHDTGKTGLWLLIFFIPFIGALVLLLFFVQPSADGSNDYGETAQPA